jgi:hypothetical protein
VTAIGTLVGPDQIFAMDAKVTPVGTTDPAVSSQTTSCDNVSHLAAWLVQAQGGDDSWSFPIFVDQTSGGETAFGSYKLVACFGPRESGSTNSESNKLMGFSLSFQGFTLPAKAGDYKWRGLLTPFGGDQSNQSGNTSTSALNQAGSVEAQSTTTIAPGALTIAARPLRSGRVVITGRLSLAGKPVRGATVAIHHGLSPAKLVSLGTAKTNAAGVFTKTVRIKGASYFQAGATAAKQNLGVGGCTASFGLPCLDATIGGTAVVSKTIHVT